MCYKNRTSSRANNRLVFRLRFPERQDGLIRARDDADRLSGGFIPVQEELAADGRSHF